MIMEREREVSKNTQNLKYPNKLNEYSIIEIVNKIKVAG